MLVFTNSTYSTVLVLEVGDLVYSERSVQTCTITLPKPAKKQTAWSDSDSLFVSCSKDNKEPEVKKCSNIFSHRGRVLLRDQDPFGLGKETLPQPLCPSSDAVDTYTGG